MSPSVGTRMRQALSTEPKKYQIQAVRFLEKNNGRGILGDDMGLGKTYEALAWLAIHSEIPRVVVVCPSSVKYQWRYQLKLHAGIESEVLKGVKPYSPSSNILIINYKILAEAAKTKTRFRFPWTERLIQFDPQLVVIDEFHYIKNQSALRTQACKMLAKNRPYIIGASGTPIEKSPADFFPMLNLIAPGEFKSYWNYGMRYCDLKKSHGVWDYSGAENLEELHERVKPWMIRRMKTDVAEELPNKIRTIIPMSLDNRKNYNSAKENFLKWVEENEGKEAVKRAERARSLTQLGKLKEIAAIGKMKSIQSWIVDFLEQSDGKLVIFCVHTKILQDLKEAFPNSAVIDGNTLPEDRQTQIDKFVKDPKCRIFIGQIRAAGVGIDGLQLVSSTVLFAELGWNFSEHEQAEDRVLRLGQKASSVNVYYSVAQNSIEEKILDILQDKHDICSRVLNGKLQTLNLFNRRTTWI